MIFWKTHSFICVGRRSTYLTFRLKRITAYKFTQSLDATFMTRRSMLPLIEAMQEYNGQSKKERSLKTVFYTDHINAKIKK